jgi:hypothetical protein
MDGKHLWLEKSKASVRGINKKWADGGKTGVNR